MKYTPTGLTVSRGVASSPQMLIFVLISIFDIRCHLLVSDVGKIISGTFSEDYILPFFPYTLHVPACIPIFAVKSENPVLTEFSSGYFWI